MKVAFLGTHRIGKTTAAHKLVYELRKSGINAGYFPEVIRTINTCLFEIDNINSRTQKYLLHKQISKEMEEELKYDILVCDRSILDTYIYFVVGKKMYNINWEYFIHEHMKTYDYLFYIKAKNKFNKKDNFNVLKDDFRQQVEDNIFNIVDKLKINTSIIKYDENKVKKIIYNKLK